MLVIADFAAGYTILAGFLAGGLLLGLAATVIEAVALRLLHWASFGRSLRDSLIANSASTFAGVLVSCNMRVGSGHLEATLLWVVVAAALSVLIEAVVLWRRSDHPWRQIWGAALIMNAASYLLLGPFFLWVLRGV